ncbi:MAG: phosphatase PAP2 family protein [Flammeovirgaceae bacterium]|jgi:undecaprenyl-diphosphatase|nr:phosphatase PAP2 family protein [Flammeovirgaceae bacterium]|tara:strand:+ start:17065 stop:17640 length:576 start_codon:yes stop_codon:yes gene_type:complete
MLDLLQSIDLYLLDLINGSGRPTLDPLMIWLSDKLIWIPLYLFLIYKTYAQFGRNFWLPLIFIVLTITLSDQITSGLMKPFFERLRPCRDASISFIVEIVSNCGGKYGFASSHAANTMGLATIFLFLFKKKKKLLTYGLLIWSLLVGYSRVYLGVHYPGDVLFGFAVGMLCAIFCYQSYLYFARKLAHSFS